MKKFVLVICIVYCSVGILYSQGSIQNYIFDHHQQRFREANPEVEYKSIQGSPYYAEDFIASTIYFTDRDSAVVLLRYDQYKDEIEFRQNGRIIWLIKNDVNAIAYGSEKMVIRQMKDGSQHYFFEIVEGKYSLLRIEKVNLLPAEPLKGFAESKPTRFESKEDEYYIQVDNLPPAVIYTRKDLADVLKENASALNFLKKEKIKPGREEDLVKVVEFLNGRP